MKVETDKMGLLIAAVEAGDVKRSGLGDLIVAAWPHPAYYAYEQNLLDAYFGSMDAALALHNALLPGWEWRLNVSNAAVYPFNAPPGVAMFYGMADNPARAWLLAILRPHAARSADTGVTANG